MAHGPIGNHPAGRHLWSDADRDLLRRMVEPVPVDYAPARALTTAAAGLLVLVGLLLGLLGTPLSGWTIAGGLLITIGCGLLARLAQLSRPSSTDRPY